MILLAIAKFYQTANWSVNYWKSLGALKVRPNEFQHISIVIIEKEQPYVKRKTIE